MLKRAIHVGATVFAVALLLSGIGACGSPAFTYVKNSDEKTYFKVPHEWQEIPTDSLDHDITGLNPDSAAAAAIQQLWWSVAYDASVDPDPDHLLTVFPTDEPILYARVARLTETQQNTVSLDSLRNVLLPVTDDARETAAASMQLTGFELLHDEVLTPADGLHGVRTVFDYELSGGILHTFDQTVLVNNDGSKLYFLIIRCSSSCYRERSAELDSIAASFTVRS